MKGGALRRGEDMSAAAGTGTDSAGAEGYDWGIPSPKPRPKVQGGVSILPPSTSGLLPPCKRPRVETLGSRGCIPTSWTAPDELIHRSEIT